MQPIAKAAYRHSEHGFKGPTDVSDGGAWGMFRDLPVLVSFLLMSDNVVNYILVAPKARHLEDQHGTVEGGLDAEVTTSWKTGSGKQMSQVTSLVQDRMFYIVSLTPGTLYTRDSTSLFKPQVSAPNMRWSIPLQYGTENLGYAKLDLVSLKIYRQKLFDRWAMIEKL